MYSSDILLIPATFVLLGALVAFVKTRAERMRMVEADEWEMPRLDKYTETFVKRGAAFAETIVRRLKIINLQIDRRLGELLEKMRVMQSS